MSFITKILERQQLEIETIIKHMFPIDRPQEFDCEENFPTPPMWSTSHTRGIFLQTMRNFCGVRHGRSVRKQKFRESALVQIKMGAWREQEVIEIVLPGVKNVFFASFLINLSTLMFLLPD